jgi:hypothetical protein
MTVDGEGFGEEVGWVEEGRITWVALGYFVQ